MSNIKNSGPPKVLEAHSALTAFRRQHFGIVRGRCLWLKYTRYFFRAYFHSAAVRQRLGTLVFDVWHFTSVQSLWRTACETAEHGLDTNPAVVRLFRNEQAEMLPTKRIKSWMSFQNLWRTAMKCQTSKIAARQRFWKLIQHLMRFVGNVSALFVVAVSHGLGTNPAAVRLFRNEQCRNVAYETH